MHPIHRLNSNDSGEALNNQNTETGIHVLPFEGTNLSRFETASQKQNPHLRITDLPKELLEDIFKRLPLKKSILRGVNL